MAKPVDPATLKDASKVENLMANARKQNETALADACFRRLCELRGEGFETPLERRFWSTVAAFEQLLSAKNGRKTVASRTRQKVARVGVKQILKDWALSVDPSDGFAQLVDAGQGDLAGEYIVVEFSPEFDAHVVQAALARLQKFGVTPPR
jgi:hypothetical protein